MWKFQESTKREADFSRLKIMLNYDKSCQKYHVEFP